MMKTINDEIAGVLADPDFDDDQKGRGRPDACG